MKNFLNTPFLRSYWVLEGKLLAGEYPGSANPLDARKKLARLYDAGIRHVVNLTEAHEVNHAGERFSPYDTIFSEIAAERGDSVTCVRHPIRDLGIPDPSGMRTNLDDIGQALEHGRPVYVHCWGGIGRTGTVVGCFLIEAGMVWPESVLDHIRHLRRNEARSYIESPETDQQRRFVTSWKRNS